LINFLDVSKNSKRIFPSFGFFKFWYNLI